MGIENWQNRNKLVNGFGQHAATHPFILHPRFLQFLEIWFGKYGSRNMVQEKWLTRKKDGFIS